MTVLGAGATPRGAPSRTSSDVALRVDGRCTACGACLATCPAGALRPAPRRPLLLAERCTGCLECVEICPRGAISWRRTRPVPR